ncbi:ABC transporter permease subunit, partial [candidate division KSB1 bacterium]|nr:ABC transporter permease subunit [candidate division KSB1 bacterium]
MLYTLIRKEILKVFTKPRTYIGFIAIVILIPLTYIGIKLDQGRFITESPGFKFMAENFLILGNVINGFFVSQIVMFFLMVHIPFLIALVAGDQIAGEATSGTLRMMLVRPPSRLQFLLSKAAVTIIYTTLLVFFLAIFSLSLGIAMFGTGELLVLDKGFVVLSASQAVKSFIIAYGFSVLAMNVVAGLAFLFSVLVENAIGPIVGTMAVVVISVIISETPIPLFEQIKPYLFTTYSNAWKKAFSVPLPASD